jgi:hypothetical protein
LLDAWHHGLINYIETKTKCLHLKKLTCKGALRQMFIRDWRYIQSCWYYLPRFVNCCPFNLLNLVQLSSPPPPPCVNKYTVYRYSYVREVVYGALLETIFCRSLTLSKLLDHPKQNLGGVREPQTDKHLPQRPLQFNFVDDDDKVY